MDREATGRRIKAARTLIPLTVPELAARLNLPGLGAKTLGTIERGERALRPQELAPLAQALEVPEAFLTGEKPAGETQLDRIEKRLDHIERLVDTVFHHRSAQGNDIIARLEALEQALTGAISQNAAEEVALIVDGIEAAWKAGKLPPVPPPTSKPKAAKTAPKRIPSA